MTQQMLHRGAVTGITSGLVLMGAFTFLWSLNTLQAWETGGWVVVGIGALLAAAFFVGAVRLLGVRSKHSTTVPEGSTWKKRNSAAFGAVFGAEGILIAVAATILGNTGRSDLIVPAIALIVGLHFYPMAWVFQRRLDTYVATWTTLVGILGIVLVLTHALSTETVNALTGVGAMLATTTYGTYMLGLTQKILQSHSQRVE